MDFEDRAVIAVDEVDVVLFESVIAFEFAFLFVAVDPGSVVEVGFDYSPVPASFEEVAVTDLGEGAS